MTSKQNSNWMSGSSSPQSFITLADVLGSGGSATPGNNVNSITLNLGVAYTGESYTQDALLFTPPGIISIPQGPGSYDNSGNFNGTDTSPAGAQAVAYVRNDQWIVLGTRDTRTQFTPGNLQPGETAVFATGSTAASLYKLDGSVTHMTTSSDNSSQCYTSISPTGWSVVTPFGTLTLDANGFAVRLSNGASFVLGGLNFPGPLSAVSSYAMLTAGTVTVPASTINLGNPGPEGYQQVVYPLAPIVPGIPLPMFSSTACSSVYVGI